MEAARVINFFYFCDRPCHERFGTLFFVSLASRFAFFLRGYKREKNMKRTLLTLLAGLGIIAAGAVQTSVRHHAQAVQVKTLMLR
jgi:hypothetical protein